MFRYYENFINWKLCKPSTQFSSCISYGRTSFKPSFDIYYRTTISAIITGL